MSLEIRPLAALYPPPSYLFFRLVQRGANAVGMLFIPPPTTNGSGDREQMTSEGTWRSHKVTFFLTQYMNANITKVKYDLKGHCYDMGAWTFTSRSSDLITTLTYILMDNFCPCFLKQLCLYKGNLRQYVLKFPLQFILKVSEEE